MPWYALITQCLGWRQKLLQTNGTNTAAWRVDSLASSTANMQSCGRTDDIKRINSGKELCDLSAAIASKLPATPPSTPIGEARPPLASLITIIGTFNRNDNTVSFQHRYSSKFSEIIQFGATVSLDKHALRDYGPLPPSANEDIKVMFHFKNFKVWEVWVAVPYSYARSRLPQLPELPSHYSHSISFL
ncbi:hypothetical protein BDV12DRAFT_172161, partial [Aspergillus spectabilis]